MKIAFFDCSFGISGDMLVGAFLDIGVPLHELQSTLNSLPLKGYKIGQQKVKKHGIQATQFQVDIEAEHGKHSHRGLAEITELIQNSSLPEEVKQGALNSFQKLAEAEAEVHGTTPDKIHFHEVGAVDAIIDIVSAHWCWWYLKLQKGYTATINVGGGTVSCAHGILPVPAPATALLLRNYTLSIGTIDTELTTPTGAVLLQSFTNPNESVPPLVLEKIGMGAGVKDIPDNANVFRLLLGECHSEVTNNTEEICVIEANIDDMSNENIPVVINELLEKGVRDAFVTPILAKKGRPAYIITALCEPALIPSIQEVFFTKTTTLGVRYRTEKRVILNRKWLPVETPWGTVKVKIGYLGEHVYQVSPEFEDCSILAKQHNLSLHEIYLYAQKSAQKELNSST